MKTVHRKKSIIYVNFPPYDNAGKILEYLEHEYEYIFHFSFNFHRLAGTKNKSTYTIIHKKRILSKTSLFQILPHPALIFLLLPVRSVVFLFQIIRYGRSIRKSYGVIDDYFTVNAFTAWCGIVLKRIGIVNRTIFWVWDYYPPIDKNIIVMFMRWLYWQFDKLSTHSDRIIFLNNKLLSLRKSIHIINDQKKYPIVGIGTTVQNIYPRHKKVSLLFIGVIKRSQGLDLIIDNADEIKKHFPEIEVHVIGSGPDEQYFRNKSVHSNIPVHYHGLLDIYSDKAVRIIKKTNIGIAMYIPEPGNVSYYGDPSKIKNYLSFGLPVITTDVFEFSREIQRIRAGLVIPYTLKAFVSSVTKVFRSYNSYSSGAIKLAKRYDYNKSYRVLFSE